MYAIAAVLIPLVLVWVLRSVFSRRCLALAAAGAPVLLLASARGWPLLLTAAGYNGGLIAAFLLDFFLSAGSRAFAVSRRMDDVLSLGVENQILLDVVYRGRHRTRIIVEDEPPEGFVVEDRSLSASLRPGQSVTLAYAVVPPRRGRFSFGNVHLRYRGRLGLAIRQISIAAPAEVKVYPDVLAIKRLELLARAGRLAALGLRAARLRGTGTNFESVREYVPGDEFRRINWKATARRGRPQSNEYQLEQTQHVFILLDTGRMMVTRAGSMTRLDHAINAALLLAHVAVDRGDRVGALAFGDEIQGYLTPGKGRGQVTRLVDFLYPLQPEMVESDYSRAFTYFAAKNHKRSLVCVFTDLIDEEVSGLLLAHLAALAPPHIPLCIALRDPLLDQAAWAEITDLDSVYRKAVAEQVLADRVRARRFLEHRGAIVVDVPPEELSMATVNKYLELKLRGRI